MQHKHKYIHQKSYNTFLERREYVELNIYKIYKKDPATLATQHTEFNLYLPHK